MIHEEIVTFEVAKLAKEKGFPVKELNVGIVNLMAILQRWLREEKFIDIAIYPIFIHGVRTYTCYVYAPNLNKPKKLKYFDTYELTLEDALKYAFKNLV